MRTYTIKRALQMKKNGDINVVNIANVSNIFWNGVLKNYKIPHNIDCGWAIRPVRGKMYGRKYLDSYKQDIKVMFDEGAMDDSKKRELELCGRYYRTNIQTAMISLQKVKYVKKY